MTNHSTVGLIGIGLLGEAFSHRLIGAGFDMIGFDLDPDKRAKLVARGGRAAESVEELARHSGPILLALFNTDQVEEVIERQLAPILSRTNRIVMCASTCDPDRIAALASRVAARGFRFLETPVSGTSEQVRRGEGVGLIGGDAETMAEVSPILDVLFPARFHIGQVGDGGRAKLAVNLVLGLNRLAVAEGLVFAERLGLDPAAFLDVLRGSAAASQVMETKGPKMVRGDFSPEGRARQTLKDAHLMLDQARQKGQRLSVLEIHADVLESCLRHGEGDLDNSVIIQEIRRRTRDAVQEPEKNIS
jgi:3-hydroxyisobutyrate dehydrogenase-like beta-hydroxyacid dehydrogenase